MKSSPDEQGNSQALPYFDAPVAAARREDSSPDATGRRIVAALVDIGVLVLVFIVMGVLFGETESGTRTSDGRTTSGGSIYLTNWAAVIYFIIVLGYYFVWELAFRRTLGKLVMGLEVISLDGTPVAISQLLIRNVVRIVDWLPFFYLVGIIAIAASSKKQRLGDMAARTSVARTNGSIR
jgi:uncharacterized RDD family membrane protein YckC